MAGKQYFLTLIGILLTACGGSPLIDNLRVRDLTYDVPTNIHVSGSPFAILDRRWFKEKKDEELRISGEAGIWFYIPDEWNGSCHVEVESSEGTGLSFVWMNSSIEGTDGVVDVPMTRPGLMRLSIQSPSEIPVASVSIRMDGIDLVYRSPVDLKDREGIFAMEEFFTTGTFPLKRDHVPAVLVEGSRALTIALPQPIDASSLTSRLLKLRGNPVSGSLILRGTGGTERKISIQLSETGNLRDLEAEFKDPFPVTEITLSLDQKPGDAAMWLSPCLTFQKRQPVPNILLITLDTTRADALGAYGRNPSVTPNLDDLASTSHVFLTARAPSPWTLPSHASLFTGLLPSRHGAGVHIPYLSPRHATLAETFSRLGYCTAGFSGGELTKGRLGLARGFSFYRDPWHFERRADDLTDDVIDYLDSNRGYPFFLFLNYFDPTHPIMRREVPKTGSLFRI